MRRAIELAKKGAGKVSPNPLVGAVIVKEGRIIAEGYHKKYGELHAERDAFSKLSESACGSDMYVTLEPCCHYGKQPPCTLAIIEHGIKNVYIGSDDPNELVAGKGIKQLKDAEKHGIQGYVPEDLLYQIVEINGEKVRVYGINIPEEKQEEHQVFVYADIEKYEEIAMSDTENRESVADTDILQGENHTDQEAYHYRIQVVNEAVAEKVIDTLSLPGISVQNTEALEKQQEQREKIMEKIWQWILGLAGSLLSGVVLIWQQGKLWMAEHQGFILYMQQISYGTWEKIWKNRKAFYIVAGGMAGEIGYLLLCMNGWKGY